MGGPSLSAVIRIRRMSRSPSVTASSKMPPGMIMTRNCSPSTKKSRFESLDHFNDIIIEFIQTKALRKFYKKNQGANNQDKLRYCQIAAKRIVPIVAFGFVSIYWITGLSLYYFPNLNGVTDF